MELRDEWYWLVREAAGTGYEACTQPQSVSIQRVSKRLLDDGNVAAGCKYLIDALRKFGLIVDDSRKWARISFDQRKTDKNESPHMEIILLSAKRVPLRAPVPKLHIKVLRSALSVAQMQEIRHGMRG